MISYGIDYRIKNKDISRSVIIDAKDVKSAKKKIGKKHGYKDGRMVVLEKVFVIGYY